MAKLVSRNRFLLMGMLMLVFALCNLTSFVAADGANPADVINAFIENQSEGLSDGNPSESLSDGDSSEGPSGGNPPGGDLPEGPSDGDSFGDNASENPSYGDPSNGEDSRAERSAVATNQSLSPPAASQTNANLTALLSSLNSTIIRIENEMNETRTLQKLIKEQLESVTNSFEHRITSETKDIHNRFAVKVDETHAAVNQTLAALREEIETVNSNIKKTDNQTISDEETRADNQNATTTTTTPPPKTPLKVNAPQNATNVTDLISRAVVEAKTDLFYGTIFSFNVDVLLNDLNDSRSNVSSEVQEKNVRGVPIAMKLNVYDVKRSRLRLWFKCYNDTNIKVRWYLGKRLQLTTLDYEYSEAAAIQIPLSELPSCRDASDVWNTTTISNVENLKRNRVIVDNEIRVKVTVLA